MWGSLGISMSCILVSQCIRVVGGRLRKHVCQCVTCMGVCVCESVFSWVTRCVMCKQGILDVTLCRAYIVYLCLGSIPGTKFL